jgi:DnaJ-class molecular chaperone
MKFSRRLSFCSSLHNNSLYFEKIAQAYDCLTNKEKRETYDRYGNEAPEEHYNHYRQRYSDDISPEVLIELKLKYLLF